MNSSQKAQVLSNQEQNFWQLGCILGASLGLPGMFVGKALSKQYGTEIAITSICVGNLVLWIIALAVVAMSAKQRNNAIENAREYLGKWGEILTLLFLVFAFLGWYTIQVTSSSFAVDTIVRSFTHSNKNESLRLGVALSFLTALLATGGIRLIKWCCTIATPLFFIYIVYKFTTTPLTVNLNGQWEISLAAITSIVITVLPGIIYIPSIFQHSRSVAHSFLGLILMTVLVISFQCSSIWLEIIETPHNAEKFPSLLLFNSLFSITFIITNLICSNLVNIYLATSGWVKLIPHVLDAKAYAIGGLIGTAMFTFVQISPPVQFFEKLINGFIANLGVVLILAFLAQIIVKHHPRVFEKFINYVCWLTGSTTTLILLIQSPTDHNSSLSGGVCATFISFLIIIFIQETIFSVKGIKDKNNYK